MTITVLLPFRGSDDNFGTLRHILHSHRAVQNELSDDVEFVIVDNSDARLAERTERLVSASGLSYLRLPKEEWVSTNRKLDAVVYALKNLECEKAFLIDDDAKPMAEHIVALDLALDIADVAKFLVCFSNPNVFDKIDCAGIYVVNSTTSSKQNWANLGIKKSKIDFSKLSDRNVLYDELAIIRSVSLPANSAYIESTPLPMYGERSFSTFWNQRLRYAYENLAMPTRCLLDLAQFPACLILLAIFGFVSIFCYIGFLSFLVTFLSWRYEKSVSSNGANTGVWPFASLWYLPYTVFTWWALVLFLTGRGVRFRTSRIVRPA